MIDIQQILSNAFQLHQKGNIEEADQIYETLLAQNNEEAEILFLSSMTSWMLGRHQAAYSRLKKAIHIDPDERYYVLLGNVCQSLGYFEEAITQYRTAIQKGNKEADTHTNMGLALYELGQTLEAQKEHYIAIEYQNDHLGAHYNLALLFLSEQKYEQAQKHLHHAQKIAPEDIEVLNNLGNTYLHLGDIGTARTFYAQALAQEPYYIEAMYNMAMSYEASGQLMEVKRRLQTLLEIHPKNLRSMRTLADIMMKEHNYYGAEQLLSIASRISPNHPPTLSKIADCLIQQDEYASAITVLEQTLTLEKTSYTWIQLGVVQRELQSQNALSICNEDIAHSFRQALQLDPDSGKAQYLLHMIEGVTPDRAPSDYITNLFNFYAPKFEEHLVDILQYQTPQKLKEFLWESTTSRIFSNVLDLGCGTGLMGNVMHEHSDQIFGLDLSPLMIQEAEKKDVYTQLFLEDIFSVCDLEIPQLDLIIAADVLVYVGDLAPLFTILAQKILKKGYLLFSVEECCDGFILGSEARFLHSLSHIYSSLPPSIEIVATKRAPLRKNNEEWVEGLLLLAQKKI
ncbi:MAG: hypothetical protein CL916_05580 [Deltaproteobacteria bacterium]|nr:hypothetical protein [Deltaproteobacteria bacterium]